MKNSKAIRVYEETYNFLEKAQAHRVTAGTDKKTIGIPRIVKAIHKYFKLNNDRYLELVELMEDEC